MKHKPKLMPRAWIATFLVLLGALFSNSSQAADADKLQDVRLTLVLENVPLQEALSEIEKRSEYRFLYKNNEIDLVRKVTIKQEQTSLKLILNKLFAGTNIQYEVVTDKILLWKANASGSSTLKDHIEKVGKIQVNTPVNNLSPDRVINGTVKSSDAGETLPGVSVAIKGTTKGAITDANGKFSPVLIS